MNKIIVILLLFFSSIIGEVYAESGYYRKHIVVVVDQTPDVQNNSGTKCLYDFLTETLLVDTDGPLSFNPQTDELSLHAFGIDGLLHTNGSFSKIHWTKNIKEMYEEFDESFIQFRGNFSNSNVDLNLFIQNKMLPLFNGSDDLAKKISNNQGITLSKFVYPCILDPSHFNISKPAVQNIILIITNFQSGLDDKGTSDDVERLKELVGYSNFEYFQKQFDRLEDPFYLIPLIKKRFSNNSGRQAQPMIFGNSLAIKSLQGVSVYISSNINLKENGYNRSDYTLDDVRISFNHNDKALAIDSIILNIIDGNLSVFKEKLDKNGSYDIESKSYYFKSREVDLQKVYKNNDNIKFEYIFFSRALDDQGQTIMPLVFTADREFIFESENLVSLMEDRTNMAITFLAVVILLIIIGYILYRVKVSRGCKRKVSMTFEVRPVSNEHFMEVRDQKVISHDCWYWAIGDPTETNINVFGHVDIEDVKFAKSFKYVVMARVQDIDTNEDFTFKPDPKIQKSDGSSYSIGEWFPVTENVGDFQFNAIAYIDCEDYRPNFSRDNILQLRIEIKLVRIDKEEVIESEGLKDYTFIVQPKIKNSNLWVAFDPGTSGSCVAYGIASNPLDKNDMFLAENTSETVHGTNRFSAVFPSRIRINYKSERLFGNQGYKAEDLEEGVEKDFTFGNEALITWNSNGVNCFQSIKKLLGYHEMLKIKGNNKAVREISGQDLAHLLVKGLCNHFEEYLGNNPHVDKEVRKQFFDNTMLARRAIVAVPNSYTLVKIQDMVDSVKRTEKFQEVHYIYESEAVFMMYLRQNWANLPKMQDRIFIVYDMGGATINITAFKINVHLIDKGNISKIEVSTLAKIGYAIGGDDIDYALIQMIYGIPTVKRKLKSKGIKSSEHQLLNKEKLLSYVRELKLEIIDNQNDNLGKDARIQNIDTFYGSIKAFFKDEFKLDIPDKNAAVEEYLKEQNKNSLDIEGFVLSNVRDAIGELLLMLGQKGAQVEMIFSGRSTLYPHIKKEVFSQIEKLGYGHNGEWKGFYENGKESDELVKTAVATGACWYAMYSTRIELHHNILTSSFGYIDNIENRQVFVPLLKAGTRFNENGELPSERVKPVDSLISDVKFVQMLGNNFKEVWESKIFHKYNLIDEVRPNQINNHVEHIAIKVDNRNNFAFKITLTGDEIIKHGCFAGRDVRLDIADENSPAYIFATSDILDIDDNAVDDTLSTNSNQELPIKSDERKSERYDKLNINKKNRF